MNSEVSIQLDLEYYQELYNQWYKEMTIWPKLEMIAGIIAICAATTMFIYKKYPEVGFVLLIFGLMEVSKYTVKKMIRIYSSLKEHEGQKQIYIKLDEEKISINSDDLDQTIEWENLIKAGKTSRGVFIWISKHNYIYLPQSSFDEDVYKFLLQKITVSY